MHKSTTKCDISPKVRQEVYDRDNHRCIICGNPNVQIAHYIPRSRLGLGIPENLACLCVVCHFECDNGKNSKQYQARFRAYLQSKYEDWDENRLHYKKWR